MAKFDYPNPSFDPRLEIISVVWPALTIDGGGVAEVTFYCRSTGQRETVRVGVDSMRTLFSPYLTGDKDQKITKLENQAKKDVTTIKMLETVVEVWHQDSDSKQLEIKRLEKVCVDHAADAQHYSQKYAGCMTQLKETEQARDALKNRVRELETTGMAKERDEYSKAIQVKDREIANLRINQNDLIEANDQLHAAYEYMRTERNTWVKIANTRAKEIDRLADLAAERTKERDEAQKEVADWRNSKPGFSHSNATATSVGPLTVRHSWKQMDDAIIVQARARLAIAAGIQGVTDRVATLETKVAKLEKAAEVPEDGFPIETCPETDFQAMNRVSLFMGGQWVEGGRNYTISGPRRGAYSSIYSPLRSMEWDRDNQPTRWKPLPK